MDVIQRLEPVITEVERERECVIIVAHQAVLRALYGYFMNRPLETIPRIDIPLHTIMELTPKADGTMAETRFFVDVDKALQWEQAALEEAAALAEAEAAGLGGGVPQEGGEQHVSYNNDMQSTAAKSTGAIDINKTTTDDTDEPSSPSSSTTRTPAAEIQGAGFGSVTSTASLGPAAASPSLHPSQPPPITSNKVGEDIPTTAGTGIDDGSAHGGSVEERRRIS